jgi:hypothetical protein
MAKHQKIKGIVGEGQYLKVLMLELYPLEIMIEWVCGRARELVFFKGPLVILTCNKD